MADEAKVEISIEASAKTGAITTTATEIEKLERRMTLMQIEAGKMDAEMGKVDKTTTGLQDTLTKFISAAAIGAFFKAAVEESLHEAEALRVLKGSVESTGASWEKYKDQIEEFAKVQQANTRFQDDVTYEVLGKLALATKSVGEAMRATTLAQNLAVASGKPLAETTNVVNMLLLGQQRAVMLATREFGNYAGGATTAQQALDNLQASTRGLAAAEQSASKDFAQMKADFGDTIQIVGDMLVPALRAGAGELKAFFTELRSGFGLLDENKTAQEKLAETIKHERDELVATRAQMQHNGLETSAQVIEYNRLRVAIDEKTAALARARGVKEEKDDGLTARDTSGEEEAAKNKAELQAKAIDDTKKLTEAEFDYKRGKIEEEVEINRLAGVDTEINASMRSAKLADISKQETKAKELESAKQKKIDADRMQAFGATLQFISTLATSKNKELAAIGKAAAISNATIQTYEAAAIAFKTGGGYPFGAILAALTVTAGLANVAKIAGVALEQGGVVEGSQAGIQATIGEKGKKEAVLPLTDSRAMRDIGSAISNAGGARGGGTVININVTAMVPEWRSIMEAIGEEAARGTPEIIRVARRLSDLAEINAGRAA